MSDVVNILSLEYSIKRFLEDEVGITSTIHNSELTPPKTFPHCYILNAPSNHEVISKYRETVESTYNFEIILYGKNKAEMSVNRNKVMSKLMFEDIPLYDSNGVLTNYKISVNNSVFESPMFVKAVENTSAYYQVSYDFSIVVTYHKNKNI